MNSRTLPLALVGVLAIAGLGQHAWYWPQLPERVATHFGVDGNPNDWMTRTQATVMLCGVQILLPLFLLAVTALAARLPSSMINIPNREYWLQPERRESTLSWMSVMMAWIAAASSAFMMAIGHLTFLANRDGRPLNITFFLTLLVGYLGIVLTLAGRSLWRFRKPAEAI